jgi:diacylglycerol kinase
MTWLMTRQDAEDAGFRSAVHDTFMVLFKEESASRYFRHRTSGPCRADADALFRRLCCLCCRLGCRLSHWRVRRVSLACAVISECGVEVLNMAVEDARIIDHELAKALAGNLAAP